MNLEEFLENQDKVYEGFRNSSLREEGTLPSDNLNGESGYIVCFRHADSVTLPVSRFSHKILENIPGIPYDPNNIHTTIFTYQVQNNSKFNPDKKVINKLYEIIQKTPEKSGHPIIFYDEWLNNQETLIFGGNPNESFIKYAENFVNEADKMKIKLKMPWGAHISAFRFSEKISPDDMKNYFECFKNAPNGLASYPTSIDLGYFILSPEGFMLKTLERKRLDLKNYFF